MKLTPEAERHLREYQKDFMQEDTQAGLIYDFLDTYKGDRVCSKQLYREALNHQFNEPADWETRAICEIMNTGIENGAITGWQPFNGPRRFEGYGKQKGWERTGNENDESGNRDLCEQINFREITGDDNVPF